MMSAQLSAQPAAGGAAGAAGRCHRRRPVRQGRSAAAARTRVTILGVLVAFIISAMTLKAVAVDGARFNDTLYEWMVLGGLKMEVGFLSTA